MRVDAPDRFGPWAPDLTEGERQARWRSMAALAMVYCGVRHPLLRLCLAAERDASASPIAWAALSSLPALTKRRLLTAYAALQAVPAELSLHPEPPEATP
jgi:hypothetical protein